MAEEHVFFCIKINYCKVQITMTVSHHTNFRYCQVFEKELIEDANFTSFKRGANSKACKLWYELNRGTKIRVRTEVGVTDYVEAAALVGQGTIGGALVSQAVLDEGNSGVFAPGDKMS